MKNNNVTSKDNRINQEDIETLTELFELLLEIDARQNKKISTHSERAQKDR